MREIKCRAWNFHTKEMFSAEEMAADQMCLLPTGKFINMHPVPSLSEVYELTDMLPLQYTGLKDKNGRDIYEGDILRYRYNLGARSDDTAFVGVVEYHDRALQVGYERDDTRFVGFILRGTEDKEFGGNDWFTTIPNIEDIEVIGNIYQNPGLLTV